MKRFLFLLVFVSAASAAHAQGVVQLSTYYPSPFGKYDRIQLVPRAGLTAPPCDPGTMYINSDAGNQLEVCNAAGNAWAPLSAGPWTQIGSDVYVTDTGANVGIGTTTPTSPLHVVAAEGMTPPGMFLEGADINVDGGPDGEFMIRNSSASGTQKIFLTGTSGATPVLTVDGVAQNVGIGTNAPEFKLSLENDGGILAKGTYGSGSSLSTSGAGTRLIWYPRKAAFRMGQVSGTQWNDANIANYSLAMGYDEQASGVGSVALGTTNTASGVGSFALGGSLTVAGDYSAAIGSNITLPAAADYSFALGYEINTTNIGGVGIGAYLRSGADGAAVLGSGVDSSNPLVNNTASSLAIGLNSNIPTLFIGPSSGVGTTGNVGIGTAAPQAKFHIDVNNNTSGGSNLGDDFIVGAEGGVGIGTTPLGGPGGAALYIKESGVERLARIVLQRSSTAKYLGIDFRRETGATEWSLMPSIEGGGSPGNFEIWEGGSSRRFVIKNATGNVGIGTADPGTNKLEVAGGPIKATGGLVIETRTTNPGAPVTGQMWLCTDPAPYCAGS